MIREITEKELTFVRKVVSMNNVSFDDQEDIVGEVMKIVCDEKTKGHQVDDFDSWLFIVTKHAINKYYIEKKKREGHICNFDDSIEEYCAKMAFFAWNNDIIDEELTASYIWDQVYSLDGQGPAILKLFYMDGYKIKEIAQMLELKENTVKTIKQRSLRELKEIMEKEGGN